MVDEQTHRHHANPNKIGKDSDIEIDTVSFLEEDAATRRGVMAWIARRQGDLFFPLLLLEGINLHLTSIRGLFARRRVEGRWLELSLLAARSSVCWGLGSGAFWRCSSGSCRWVWHSRFWVQLAVFGLIWAPPLLQTISACRSSRAMPSWTS